MFIQGTLLGSAGLITGGLVGTAANGLGAYVGSCKILSCFQNNYARNLASMITATVFTTFFG